MASIDTTAPRKSSSASRSGIAVISLDFSATACCANTQRARPAKALTRWTAGFAPSRLPRKAFPSRHTGSSAKPGSAAVAQAVKAARNATGSIRPSTSLKVSCEGIPLGNSKKPRNQVSFSSANASIPTQSSTPLSTAQRTIIKISWSWWSLLRVSRRGSGRLAKYGRGSSSRGSIRFLHPINPVPLPDNPSPVNPPHSAIALRIWEGNAVKPAALM